MNAYSEDTADDARPRPIHEALQNQTKQLDELSIALSALLARLETVAGPDEEGEKSTNELDGTALKSQRSAIRLLIVGNTEKLYVLTGYVQSMIRRLEV